MPVYHGTFESASFSDRGEKVKLPDCADRYGGTCHLVPCGLQYPDVWDGVGCKACMGTHDFECCAHIIMVGKCPKGWRA